MASLRNLLREGRVQAYSEVVNDANALKFFYDRAKFSQEALQSHDTILVNATSVAEDIGEGVVEQDPKRIPCPKPPFTHMWLEVNYLEKRQGVLVRRTEIRSQDELEFMLRSILPQVSPEQAASMRAGIASFVETLVWCEWQGYAHYFGMFAYWLNAAGDYMDGIFSAFPEWNDEIENTLYVAAAWLLHAFARLNCHNVKLVPASGGPKIKPGSKRPPFSVWHEISVTAVPELRREQKDAGPDGEKRELRFHKVRGHYADYTKGKGLFGRLKVRIWFPEHTAGNPELGTVIGSYKVKR